MCGQEGEGVWPMGRQWEGRLPAQPLQQQRCHAGRPRVPLARQAVGFEGPRFLLRRWEVTNPHAVGKVGYCVLQRLQVALRVRQYPVHVEQEKVDHRRLRTSSASTSARVCPRTASSTSRW